MLCICWIYTDNSVELNRAGPSIGRPSGVDQWGTGWFESKRRLWLDTGTSGEEASEKKEHHSRRIQWNKRCGKVAFSKWKRCHDFSEVSMLYEHTVLGRSASLEDLVQVGQVGDLQYGAVVDPVLGRHQIGLYCFWFDTQRKGGYPERFHSTIAIVDPTPKRKGYPCQSTSDGRPAGPSATRKLGRFLSCRSILGIPTRSRRNEKGNGIPWRPGRGRARPSTSSPCHRRRPSLPCRVAGRNAPPHGTATRNTPGQSISRHRNTQSTKRKKHVETFSTFQLTSVARRSTSDGTSERSGT